MTREDLRALIADLSARAGIGGVSPRVVLLTVGVALVVALVCAVRWLAPGDPSLAFERRGIAEDAASQPGAIEPSSTASTETSVPIMLWVHVVGAVRSPAVVSLPPGSRVADAIDAVGGLLSSAQVRGVNMARLLVDGEQIVVPTQDEWEAGGTPGPATGSSAQSVGGAAAGGPGAQRIDLNTASAAELDTLPGVGPSTAGKIVADREANGPFAAPEDLMRVSGIGPKKFEALKEFLMVP